MKLVMEMDVRIITTMGIEKGMTMKITMAMEIVMEMNWVCWQWVRCAGGAGSRTVVLVLLVVETVCWFGW